MDKAAMRRADRHRIRPGFPKTEPFRNLAELEEYLGGDQWTCLLCGREMSGPGSHLIRMHNMESDEYKRLYEIPVTQGLNVPEVAHKISQNTRARIESGQLDMADARSRLPAQIPHGYRGVLAEQRRTLSVTRWTVEDYHEVLDLASSRGCHPLDLAEVASGSLPGESKLWSRRRAHPEFSRRWDALVESLPFRVQAAHRTLGARFSAEVRRLHGAGFTIEWIAHHLGVSTPPVAARIRFQSESS